MIPPDIAGLFFLASLALAVAPGPDNIFVLAQSAMHGRIAGILVTLGLCTGLLVHTAGVALGVAAIFRGSAPAFTGLKIAGALYLLYLAWQAFRAGAAGASPGNSPTTSGWRLYRRGIVMNVCNPKVAIFFLAFLPQFADPARGSLTLQIAALGGLFIAAALPVFCAIALGAGALGDRLRRSPRLHRVLNRIAALVFVALAVRLATGER